MPPLADFDPPAAPIGEPFVFGVLAPLKHAVPASVGPRLSPFRRIAVGRFYFDDSVSMETPAAIRVSARQILSDDFDFGAAIAPTDPPDAPYSTSSVMENGKAAKALAGEIFEGNHTPFNSTFLPVAREIGGAHG